eukprot:TRINITY_DN2230_c0_g1_i1.p1 TRINITY_DN2230_c0_g1~~TRINITY_DN2230_c0_g1_i1.p1  ORF type:complete len:1073 (+),score=269.94 TRINITY_DN2230_c0_g1_i1:30-3221(+)
MPRNRPFKEKRERSRKLYLKEKKGFLQDMVKILAAENTDIEKHREYVTQQNEQLKQQKKERQRARNEQIYTAKQKKLLEQREEDARYQEWLKEQEEERQALRVKQQEEERKEEELEAKRRKRQKKKQKGKGVPKLVVQVHRTPQQLAQRMELPIIRCEQEIMEHVIHNPTVIVSGETGSGKTTQVPQFLYEAGYSSERSFHHSGRIGVTEPRRVAAFTMARRVAEEMNFAFGQEVGYQVRYNTKLSPQTRIKFMTEGILLRELQHDFLLRQYSAILLDEAHERSVNVDILLGMLARIVPLRAKLHEEYIASHPGMPLTEDEVSGGREPPADPKYVSPLKLVVMSATLRVSDFTQNTKLFATPPPVANVDARQYKVTKHFSSNTNTGKYITAMFHRIEQIHERLPEGGILVFLSTQREIEDLLTMLRNHYQRKRTFYPPNAQEMKDRLRAKAAERRRKEEEARMAANPLAVPTIPNAKGEAPELDEFGLAEEEYHLSDDEEEDGKNEKNPEGEDEQDMGSSDEDDVELHRGLPKREQSTDGDDAADAEPIENVLDGDGAEEEEEPQEAVEDLGDLNTLWVLPLYSLLDPALQNRVFESPPAGKRLCVIATNVAETSITIPGIRYVVDSGRVKAKKYSHTTGVITYRIAWTSRASAEQRAGRAGRTMSGHCYRMYTPAVYTNYMPEFSQPEIANTPVESVVLMMKSMGINDVYNFPFPTPPSTEALDAAIKHLNAIRALDENERCTAVGKRLAYYPLLPRYARMLDLSNQAFQTGNVLRYVLLIVSCLTVITDIFVKVHMPEDEEDDEEADNEDFSEAEKQSRKWLKEKKKLDREKRKKMGQARQAVVAHYTNPGSDMMTFLKVAQGYLKAKDPRQFCRDNFLIEKNMREVAQLREQLVRMVLQQGVEATALPEDDEDLDAEQVALAAEQRKLFDVSAAPAADQEVLIRKVIAGGLVDQVARRASLAECEGLKLRYTESTAWRSPYLDLFTNEVLWIHPDSAVAQTHPPPEFVVFAFVQEANSKRAKVAESEGKNKKPPPKSAQKKYMKCVTAVTAGWLKELGQI